jgi:predicted hotdog family 3-hydroxylacyl-ACP dehydratase
MIEQTANIPDLQTLLPHRPPMRWIAELTACTENEATASACFSANDFPVNAAHVSELALIECMAQTIAAAQSYRSRAAARESKSNGPPGMLAAVTGFVVHSQPQVGQHLQIQVREIKRLGPMLLVSGEIRSEGQLVASGQLSLYA